MSKDFGAEDTTIRGCSAASGSSWSKASALPYRTTTPSSPNRPAKRRVNREFSSETKVGKTTVFLSHKHDERKELDSAISFLKKIGVNVYVDWLDSAMPKTASGETAKRIKNKIKENKKFVFLATEGAINSKWCNWELGYGDSQRYIKDIAILPIKDDDRGFTGSEYMQIYPYIEFVGKNSVQRLIGGYFDQGYYVITPKEEGGSFYQKIADWFSRV